MSPFSPIARPFLSSSTSYPITLPHPFQPLNPLSHPNLLQLNQRRTYLLTDLTTQANKAEQLSHQIHQTQNSIDLILDQQEVSPSLPQIPSPPLPHNRKNPHPSPRRRLKHLRYTLSQLEREQHHIRECQFAVQNGLAEVEAELEFWDVLQDCHTRRQQSGQEWLVSPTYSDSSPVARPMWSDNPSFGPWNEKARLGPDLPVAGEEFSADRGAFTFSQEGSRNLGILKAFGGEKGVEQDGISGPLLHRTPGHRPGTLQSPSEIVREPTEDYFSYPRWVSSGSSGATKPERSGGVTAWNIGLGIDLGGYVHRVAKSDGGVKKRAGSGDGGIDGAGDAEGRRLSI